jgi:hypothetical protein
VQHTKTGKTYQIAIKYNKWPQIAVKQTKFPNKEPTTSIAKPSKVDPNRNFWFENMPPGNPGPRSRAVHTNSKTLIFSSDFETFLSQLIVQKTSVQVFLFL